MATSPKHRPAMLPRYSTSSSGSNPSASSRRQTPRQLIVLLALLLLVTSGSMLVFHVLTGGPSSSSSSSKSQLGCNKDEDFAIIRWESNKNNIMHKNDNNEQQPEHSYDGHPIGQDGLNRINYGGDDETTFGNNRDAGSPWGNMNDQDLNSNDKSENTGSQQDQDMNDNSVLQKEQADSYQIANNHDSDGQYDSDAEDSNSGNGEGSDDESEGDDGSSVSEEESGSEGQAGEEGEEESLEDQDLEDIDVEEDGEEDDEVIPFEDTLDQLNDEKFLTYLPYAGITNQFYGILRGLEVAKALGRTLIIPPITASSHDKSKQNQPWSKFLDLAKFQELTSAKVIEYHELRDVEKVGYNTFSCHITCGFGSKRTIDFTAKGFLKQWKFNHTLSNLAVDANKIETIAKVLTPYRDDKFICISNTYKISIPDKSEWKRFGQHLHFTTELEDFVAEYLDRTLEKPEPVYDSKSRQEIVPTPRYIAIHARRGDFAQYCEINFKGAKRSSCLPSTEDFAQRVEKVQNAHNPSGSSSGIMPVFVATNERKTEELKKFADLGWTYLDHDQMGSAERLGVFGPMMVDQVFMAHAQALIGIQMSTFSRVGALRQQDWHKRKMQYM